MPTTSETTVFDTFFTATIKAYDSKLHQNFLKYWAIIDLLMNDYANSDSRGGRLFQTSAEYGLNSGTKFFSGADTFSEDPAQTAQPITYQWRYLGSSVTISETEMLENRGTAALWNITESRIRQAERTMNLVLGQECYSDGTNYGGQTIVGLAAGVSTTPTADPSSGAVGGLSVSSFPFWQNNASTSCGSFAANGVKGSADDIFERQWNNCSDGMQKTPSGVISAQDVYEYYHRTLLGTVRYLDPVNTKEGDLSMGGLQYHGKPWRWDRLCPSGRAYILNNQDIKLWTDPACRFKWTPPIAARNQLIYTRIVALRISMAYTARMFSAVLDGWTA